MALNCPNCGGPISVSDEFCPYCGSLNQTKEKEKVKKAETKVKNVKSVTTPLIIVVVLIVLNLIVAAIGAGAYTSGHQKRRDMNEARADEIEAQFKGYIDDHDYLMANAFYNEGDYYGISTMKQYRMVCDALSYYSSVFYKVAPVRPTKYNSDGLLDEASTVAREMHGIYDLSTNSYYDFVPSEETNEITSDIVNEAETLVAAAYHLTPEEVDSMYRMKEDEIAKLLQQAYIRNAGASFETEDE